MSSTSNRHKTLRAQSPGPGPSNEVGQSLDRLLGADADAAYKKPWHRLERGLRLNRLRKFTERMGETRGLKPAEQQSLLTLLTKALDKKVLNSKTAVTYDMEKEEIAEIKPLIMHHNAAGEMLFQILERRNNVTFRKRGTSAEPATEA